MAFTFNGNTTTAINFNNQEVTTLQFNGTTVWTMSPKTLNIMTEFTSSNWTRSGGTSFTVSNSMIRLVNGRNGGTSKAVSDTFDITNLKTLSHKLSCYNSYYAPDVTWGYGGLYLIHSGGKRLQITPAIGEGTTDVSSLKGDAYFSIECGSSWYGENGVDWRDCDLIILKLQFT